MSLLKENLPAFESAMQFESNLNFKLNITKKIQVSFLIENQLVFSFSKNLKIDTFGVN
jgi:hypothetical protein